MELPADFLSLGRGSVSLEPSILCMVWVWELLNSFRVGLI